MSTPYLLNHPQKVPQYRAVRRNGAEWTGTTVIHTAENITDFIGEDSGAENVARYFTTALRQASYHGLADSDSRIQCVPWASEAWHDTRTNNWAVGLSVAIQCKDWKALGERGRAAIRQLAELAAEAAEWLYKNRGILVPAKHITRAEALARKPGFIGHGEIDTGRRTDPGKDFDWTYFLAEFAKRRDARLNRTNSPDLKPVAKPSTLPKPGWYHVAGLKSGETLNGRASASLTGTVKHKRANGFDIYIKRFVKKDGIVWGETNYGTFYSNAYLTKGKAPKALGWYHVTGVGSSRLMGRANPNRNAAIKHRRKAGHNLYIAKTVQGDGMTWAVTNHGTYYAMKHLKKGKKP